MPPASPFFSVILPTLGRPELLARALASLWAQTFSDFEVLLVDVNPPEARMRAVEALQPYFADPRLRVIETPGRVTAAAARNLGLEVARGAWIVYQDDDDASVPERLARLAARIATEPGCPVLLGGLRYHLQGRVREVQCAADRLTGDARWTGAYPATLALVHWREGAPRFPEHLLAGEDNYFYFALLRTWQPTVVPVIAEPLVEVYPQPVADPMLKARRLVAGWRAILRAFRRDLPAPVRRHFVLHTAISRYKYRPLDLALLGYLRAYLAHAGLPGARHAANVLLSRFPLTRRRVVS